MAIGQGVYPDLDALQDPIRKNTAKLIAFDAAALAKDAGSVMSVNMVLLGALIQSDTLPLSPEKVKTAMRARIRKDFVEINLKAFELGFSTADNLSR